MNDDDGCLVNPFDHSQDSLRASCIMLSPHQKTVLQQQRCSGKLTSLSAHRVAMLDDPNTILVDCWFLSLLVKARVSGCPMLVTVFTIRDHETVFQNFLRLTGLHLSDGEGQSAAGHLVGLTISIFGAHTI
jgi:hypothetical protein